MSKKATRITTNKLSKLYIGVISSVAFYPTLIAFGLFLLSILTLYLDERTPSRIFGNEVPIKNILAPNSVRSLLGAIGGGMISLMVFSFSMVMVILNQAASNYSPRLLPNMIEKKHHQVVLGVYLGTIAYTFVVLSSIQSEMFTFGVPTLSVTINALLGLICLGLFIYFINSISQIIQIGNIISDLYMNTLEGIRHEINEEVYIPPNELPDIEAWQLTYSPVSGYMDSIDHASLLSLASKLDIRLKICVPLGQFVNHLDPILLSSRSISKKECADIFHSLVFRHQENVSQNYIYGFKQLSEVATKALSPGINDPGTAIQALDRLTALFVERLKVTGFKIKTDKQGNLRIIYEPVHFQDLLYYSIGTIINYADNDLPVNHKLVQSLDAIARNDDKEQHTDIILSMLDDMVTHYMRKFVTLSDQRSLSIRVQQMIRRYPKHPTTGVIQNKIAEVLPLNTAW
ncbi:DUF2254 domain-containing protein [Catalinimonas alkaloidigena]|uniref:DUF2254 domain-containing protein n=1 Tax=Catalinimonas alkaloidigena TaxID=1075417 RepID=UPI00240521B5|nr:DUF2254 domain-containing protein [Catalinimonas alkaloidigena]